MRLIVTAAAAASVIFFSGLAAAKMPPKIDKAINEAYQAADMHHGLETAYYPPDPNMLHGFVVIEKDGIPAERARHFVTWSDYDYRGAIVHLDKGDEITTRRGSTPYAYLKRGDVMIIAEVSEFGRTIYFKLLSDDIYVPESHEADKHHSRVSVMVGFKMPKSIYDLDDSDAALQMIGSWIKSFADEDQAQKYAESIKKASEASQARQARQANEVETEKKAVKAEAPAASEAQRVQDLEEKIEAARRQIDDAQQELQQLKQQKQSKYHH